jgi:hypothetical protein
MDIQLVEGEVIIKEGPANHFKGAEAVGGKLYLTNQRLFFKSHTVNVHVHEESYRLEDITSVRLRNTLGIVPNGMAVLLKDGREEKFVVYGRKDWMEKILHGR